MQRHAPRSAPCPRRQGRQQALGIGQREFLKAWFSRGFLPKWTKTGQSYFIPQLAGFDAEDVWQRDRANLSAD